MSKTNLDKPLPLSETDERFVAGVGLSLQRQPAELNAAQLSRLNQARQAALEQMTPRGRSWFARFDLAPLSAVGLAVMLAVTLWLFDPGADDPAMPSQAELRGAGTTDPAPGELELLLDEADPEMLRDLDFYAWLESELAESDATG